MKLFNKLLFTTLLSLIISISIYACTTIVVSGKYTKDGKPMIWKLRDTESFKNKLVYFTDGKYDYIGLVNTEDIKGENVWGGSNSKGFAIMNSASFNVNLKDTTKLKDQEGIFMKLALQKCATLEDFEKLLNKTKKPMGLAAHFGVLDAQGGVAFYEVNNYGFKKFDANDPKVAPNGYILRTNYSFTGEKDKGYGYIRFQTAQDLLNNADATNSLNYQTIIQDFSRCFRNSLLNTDFRAEYEHITNNNNFINSGDLITRHGSSSSILIQGVKKGESADFTTIWTHIGFPNTTVALPVWIKGGKNLPRLLVADKNNYVPLNEMALKLKKQCYPISRSSGYKYLNISKLINTQNTGYVQIIEKFEQKIFSKFENQMQNWQKNSDVNFNDIQNLYSWLDKNVEQLYNTDLKL